jgi:small-conductance mechanosensitive channel
MLHGVVADLFDPKTPLGALTYGVILMSLAWGSGRGINALARHSQTHLSDLTALRFVTQLLKVLIFTLALIIYTRVIPALHELGTTLLTGVSVMGVVIGLAAQATLGNLIAGFSLVLYRPFHVGDEVLVTTPKGAVSGVVRNLSLGYTMLQDREGQQIIVPNSVMSSTVIILVKARQTVQPHT